MKVITGGVTAAKGFEAAGAEAGIKYKNRKDMAIVYSRRPCVLAGTFTSNVVKAAPVLWDKKVVEESPFGQAVIINAGIANACTGKEGRGDGCRARAKRRCGTARGGAYPAGHPKKGTGKAEKGTSRPQKSTSQAPKGATRCAGKANVIILMVCSKNYWSINFVSVIDCIRVFDRTHLVAKTAFDTLRCIHTRV